MSQAHDASKLITYLDSLESALDNGSPEDVLAFLRVLRMNGLTDETSARLVESFSQEPASADFERVQAWVDTQRSKLDVIADKVDDLDSAVDDGVDALLDDLGDFDPFENEEFVSVADDLSEIDDFEDADADEAFVSFEADDEFEDIAVDVEDDSSAQSGPHSSQAFPPSEEFSADEFFGGPDELGEPTDVSELSNDDSSPSTPPSDSPKSDSQKPAQSFPPSEEFEIDELFGPGDTPEPPPTTRNLGAESSASLAQSHDSEPASTGDNNSSAITGKREKTRQFDPAQLQALSSASSAKDELLAAESSSVVETEDPEMDLQNPDNDDFDFAMGASISTPLEDYGLRSDSSSETQQEDSDVHHRPTRREFRAPTSDALSDGPTSNPPPDSAQEAETTQMAQPNTDAADTDDSDTSNQQPATAKVAQPDYSPASVDDGGLDLESGDDSGDDFEFDLAPETGNRDVDSGDDFKFDLESESSNSDVDFDFEDNPESPPADSGDDFDFDLGPESEPQDSGDDFDFDLGPESEPQDSGDDFDFDFGPEPEPQDSGDDFDFDFGPEPEPQDSGDDFDFGLKPETKNSAPELDDDSGDDFDVGLNRDTGDSGADHTPAPSQDGDMGYAPPPADGDSFFPPPLTSNQSQNNESSFEQSPTPAPFPESPSVAGAPFDSDDDEQTGQTDAPPRQIEGQRPRQQTPLAQSSDMQALQQSQKTPPRGSSPAITDDTHTPAPSDDDTPLPEDEFLALGEELSTSKPPSDDLSESANLSESNPRYRGEPMVREAGDEPTPAAHTPTPTPIPDPEPESRDQTPTGFMSSDGGGSEQTNPFAHEAPTGVQNKPLEVANPSSFVLEEVDDSDSQISNPAEAVKATLQEARSLYEEAKFEESLDLVEAVLDVDEDSQEAHELQRMLEGEMERVMVQRLGSLSKTPSLAVSMGEVAGLDIDHRAGFLISQIDGMLTFEDILDMSAMSRLETLTLLVDLFEQDIISVD